MELIVWKIRLPFVTIRIFITNLLSFTMEYAGTERRDTTSGGIRSNFLSNRIFTELQGNRSELREYMYQYKIKRYPLKCMYTFAPVHDETSR